jgi:hypothetical protein
VSSRRIQRETGVTYKCAWDLRRKIRKAMVDPEIRILFEKIAKIDETCIGERPMSIVATPQNYPYGGQGRQKINLEEENFYGKSCVSF